MKAATKETLEERVSELRKEIAFEERVLRYLNDKRDARAERLTRRRQELAAVSDDLHKANPVGWGV